MGNEKSKHVKLNSFWILFVLGVIFISLTLLLPRNELDIKMDKHLEQQTMRAKELEKTYDVSKGIPGRGR